MTRNSRSKSGRGALPVIVIGTGGHARVLLDVLKLLKVPVLGTTDATPSKVDRGRLAVPFLGTDASLREYPPQRVRLVNGLGSVGNMEPRRKVFERFKSLGYTFASVIHPSSVVARDVVMGEGVQIMAGAVIQTGSTLGNNVIINTRVSLDHDAHIGDHVHVAPGAVLSGGVTIGNGSHVGTGAIIVQQVRVPSGTFIKAGTLVKAKTFARFKAMVSESHRS